MEKYVSFEQGKWNPADFVTAASVRVDYRLLFGQKADCIHNEGADRMDEYAYVSMVLRESVDSNCFLSTECSFNKYGAPLLVLSDELKRLDDGRMQYGHHIEVVGWENGVNVWDITADPTQKDGQKVVSLGKFSFPIAGGERFLLTARYDGKGLKVGAKAGDRAAEFDCPGKLADRIYVGLTACEGENYFYNFTVR